MAQHKKIFLFIGPPGCGKGTQIDLLREKFREDAEFFGMGDYIREKRRQDEGFNQFCINGGMDDGILLSDEISKVIVNEVIDRFFNSKKRFLFLDGYPRTLTQYFHIHSLHYKEHLEQFCFNIFPIIFEVPDGVLLDRIKKRAVTSGRTDDKKAVERIGAYRIHTYPIVNVSAVIPRLMVDGEKPVDQVYKKIFSFITEDHPTFALNDVVFDDYLD